MHYYGMFSKNDIKINCSYQTKHIAIYLGWNITLNWNESSRQSGFAKRDQNLQLSLGMK